MNVYETYLDDKGKDTKVKKDSGFTLIEVLIAMGIFAIGFLAVGLMQVDALTKTNSARITTEALTVAEDWAEQLRAMPFYADENGADDDGDGTADNYDVLPDLSDLGAGNNHTRDQDGDPTDLTPYTVRWTVDDDVPIDAYDAGVLTVGTPLTRSKTIRLWVTPDTNANDIQAEIIFAKVMAADAN